MTGSSKFWTWFLTGVLTLGIVVLANFFVVNKVKMRWDVTEDKRYTLAAEAKDIAARLTDVCTVTCYLSDPLPTILAHVPKVLRTRLEEFREASENLLEFRFVSPDPDMKSEEAVELSERNIRPYTIPDQQDGKRVVGEYYLTLEYKYGDREEIYTLASIGQDIVSETEFSRRLPYEIASRLVKLMNTDATLGIASDKKPAPEAFQQLGFPKEPTDALVGFRGQLETSLGKPMDVNIKNGLQVADNIDTLMVYRPEGLDERHIYEIDQALMKGKSVVVLLDNYASIEFERFQADYQAMLQQQPSRIRLRPIEHGLTDWLRHYGIEVEPGHVESEQAAVAVRTLQRLTNQGIVLTTETSRFPSLVYAREQDPKTKEKTGQFADDEPSFAGLGSAGGFTCVPMSIDPEGLASRHGSGASVRPVVTTSKDSYVRDPLPGGVLTLKEPKDVQIPTARKSYVLAAQVTPGRSGSFKSYFAGKNYGEGDAATDRPPRKNPDGTLLPPGPNEEPKLDESIEVGKGRLWVFADADFVSDFYLVQRIGLAQASGSQDAMASAQQMTNGLLGVLQTLTTGPELTEVRKANLVNRTLDQDRIEEERDGIRFWAVWFGPLVLIGLGLVWWILRWLVTRVPDAADGMGVAS